MEPGIKTAAIFVLAAFAIDRIAAGVMFMWAYFAEGVKAKPQPRAAKNQRLVYFIVAAVLAVIVVSFVATLRLLHALGLDTPENLGHSPILDFAITALALVGGSDQIASMLAAPHSAAATRQPVEVAGTLTVIEPESTAKS